MLNEWINTGLHVYKNTNGTHYLKGYPFPTEILKWPIFVFLLTFPFRNWVLITLQQQDDNYIKPTIPWLVSSDWKASKSGTFTKVESTNFLFGFPVTLLEPLPSGSLVSGHRLVETDYNCLLTEKWGLRNQDWKFKLQIPSSQTFCKDSSAEAARLIGQGRVQMQEDFTQSYWSIASRNLPIHLLS